MNFQRNNALEIKKALKPRDYRQSETVDIIDSKIGKRTQVPTDVVSAVRRFQANQEK